MKNVCGSVKLLFVVLLYIYIDETRESFAAKAEPYCMLRKRPETFQLSTSLSTVPGAVSVGN